MTPSKYIDRTSGALVRAFRISGVESHPVQGDSGATKLSFVGGKESVVRGVWFTENQPLVGGWFVIPAKGASFVTDADFLRRYELAEEVA